MKKQLFSFIFSSLACSVLLAQETPRYLIDNMYSADASAHVFNNKTYIYPSHDIESEVKEAKDGGHYDMKDYHVFSMDSIKGKVTDHGIALSLADIPWAKKQLWAPDCAYKNDRYYLYFPAKDKNDIFKIGVAVSKTPEGPFKAEKNPIKGSYSIDPTVFKDSDGSFYMYFGGISGGQLQNYKNNKAIAAVVEPAKEENAATPKIAKLAKNMLEYAEEPKDVLILDKEGKPLKVGDGDRRFFEGVWMHLYKEKYYLSYSTGTTHKLCYAIGENPYGPFVFEGEILSPVSGWTTHHSIVEIDKKWYLFYHDTKQSKVNSLRNVKVRLLEYNPDGTIQKMNGQD